MSADSPRLPRSAGSRLHRWQLRRCPAISVLQRLLSVRVLSNSWTTRSAVAPDLTLHVTPNQTLSLKELLGRPVILAFYLADWSPVCGDQMALYNEIHPEFTNIGLCWWGSPSMVFGAMQPFQKVVICIFRWLQISNRREPSLGCMESTAARTEPPNALSSSSTKAASSHGVTCRPSP